MDRRARVRAPLVLRKSKQNKPDSASKLQKEQPIYDRRRLFACNVFIILICTTDIFSEVNANGKKGHQN